MTKREKTPAKILVGLVGIGAVIGIASALIGGGNAENASSPSSAEAIPAEATSVAVTSEATPAGESYGGLLTEAEAENAATFFLVYPGYSDIYAVADCHGVGGEVDGHFASFHCTGLKGEDLVATPVVVDVMGTEPDNPNVLVEVRER